MTVNVKVASTKQSQANRPGQAPVALVTGAAGNIGRQVCVCLARDGYRIVAADYAPDPGDLPPGCSYAHLDVRDEVSIRAAFDTAASMGPVTAVVAAHGILAISRVDDATKDDLQPITDVNLLGVALLCVEAGRRMGPGGAIVNVSSVVATMGRRGAGAFMYTAIKAGVEALTRSFAVGLGPKGIRVNAVAPGFLTTPMSGLGAEARAKLSSMDEMLIYSPLGRLATPGEVAEAISFLCSPRASGISGVVLPVDVGQRAW